MRKILLLLGLLLILTASASAQKVIAEKAFTVKESGYTWFDFTFEQTTDLKGRSRATGGKNDIEVYILDSDNFENWKNGNEFRAYYSSGRVTVASFDVRLPKGTYHLVFSNRWAIMTPKAVSLWFYE
ncbi:MAG TPA: hypothetical protein VK892_11075 [Pyrinomonadaceae bacterium]|nr:hypothetical protein [Pyrinomonadaceae bacterium]